MPTNLNSEWIDCRKIVPYRDFEGKWRIPWYTQQRRVLRDGRVVVERRERKETADEFYGRQY